MKTTHRITIDLIRKDVSQVAYAMQNDANSRVIEITLLENGVAWTPPAETSFALSYAKPDGTKGFYGTLPDGSNAISSDGNIVSATLAPQVLTVAGVANAALVIRNPDGNRISSFPFEIHVIADPSAGATDSEDYFDPSFCGANFLPMPAVANVGQYLRVAEVDKDGNIIKVEAVDTNAKTPDGYSYNGVQLPKLPEWDKEMYPYAVISYREGIDQYYLSVHKSINYYKSKPPIGTERTYFGSNEEGTALLFGCNTGSTVWTKWENTYWSICVDKNAAYDPAIWTNFDLLYSDDTVYVAASEPVPVYSGGGSGGSGGGGLPNVVLTSIPSLDPGSGTLSESENEALAAVESAKTGCTITLNIADGEFYAVLPTSMVWIGGMCAFVALIPALQVALSIFPNDMGGAGYAWDIDELRLT